jgi:protein disulfide-isomerase
MSNILKNISFIVAFMFASFSINAQEAYAAENEGWYTSIEKAYTESIATGKPIMANFTGSDWCGWCKRLTANVFVHEEFKTWAKKNVILLELDFPKRKNVPADVRKQNEELKNAFAVRGFPTIWVFNISKDDKGQFNVDPLGKTGYSKTVSEFTTGVDQIIATKS